MTQPETTTNDLTSTADTTGSEPESANREAARYRRQLRDVEAERDRLTSVVDGMRRRTIEEIAARDHGVVKPDALWTGEVDLAQLLGDDGQLNPEAVNGWITSSIDTLGLASKPPAGYVAGEGRIPRGPATAGSWKEFLANS